MLPPVATYRATEMPLPLLATLMYVPTPPSGSFVRIVNIYFETERLYRDFNNELHKLATVFQKYNLFEEFRRKILWKFLK